MNVLSIDFDWIMEPCIEAYNNMVQGSRLGPVRVWEQIHEIIPNFVPECDLEKFHKLFFFLLYKGKSLTKDDIYIGMNHDEINYFLKNVNEKIYLYNVDHHHDLGYPSNDEDTNAFEQLGVGNWVTFLNKEKKLSSYTWIHNKNSNHPRLKEIENLKRYSHSTDLAALEHITFDKIFICSSWEWVPLKYESLFDILITVIDKN